MNHNNMSHAVKPDRFTVLTCRRPLIATKRWHRRATGGWRGDAFDSMRHYSARFLEVASFDALVRVLRGLSRATRDLHIRDLPAKGVDLDDMRKMLATTSPQPLGLRSLCVDVEKLRFEALGVSVDPTSRESLEAAVRAVADHLLPESMRGARLYYQWSSSAGVRGWEEVRLHLWLWLDRPVFRGSLKRWARGVEGVDQSLYDAVRIHYTADPVFVDHLGARLDDIMGRDAKGSLRCGVLEGRDAIAPPGWLARPEHEALERAEASAVAAQRAADARAQSEAMGDPVMRERYRAAAWGILRAIQRDLEPENFPGENRHGYVRGRIRRAFGVRNVISAAQIAEAVRAPAEKGLVEAAGRRPDVAAGEVDRLIVELIKHPSRAKPLPIRLSGSDSAGQASEPATYALDEEGFLTPHVERLKVAPAAGKQWAAPSGGWVDESAAALSLEEGHAWLAREVANAVAIEGLEGGARVAINAAAGSGKSWAAKAHALIDLTRDDGRAALHVPTLALAREAAEDLQAMARSMGVRDGWRAVVATTRRGPSEGDPVGTCYYPEEVSEAARLVPNGGSTFCRACEFHPGNIGSKIDACPFWRARRLEATAAVVVKTHALAVLEGQLGADEEEGEFEAIVIDEDPHGAMLFTGALDAADIARLVASHDLRADNETLGALLRALAETSDGSRRYDASDLRAMFPPGSIEVEDSYLDGIATLAGALMTRDKLSALRSGVSWRAVAGLAEAIQEDWGACSLERGALSVSHPMPLELRRGKRVIYLDATSSAARARALLGAPVAPPSEGVDLSIKVRRERGSDGVTRPVVLPAQETGTVERDHIFRRLRSALPEHVEVLWAPVSCGPRSRLHVEGARRVPLIWSAILDRYASEGALVVTSKRNRDPERWTGALLERLEQRGALVTHHNGPEGRGVNRFKGCHTVIIDPWHVPRSAVEQGAYSWCRLANHDWTHEPTREFWLRESRAQLEGAAIIQTVNRIRALQASEEAPKTIVIIDPRDPRSLGFPVDDVLDADRVVFEQLGIETGVDTAPSILRSLLDHCGGSYCPSADGRSHMKTVSCAEFSRNSVERQSSILDALPDYMKKEEDSRRYASDVVRGWLSNHGGALALARRAGVEVTQIRTDLSGRALAMFHRGRLHISDVEHWLRPLGARRFRIEGMPCWVEIRGVDANLRSAIATLEARPGWSTQSLVDALASTMGASESTVRREVERLRAPPEGFDDALRRIIAETLEEVAQRMPAHAAGFSRGEALREIERRAQAIYYDTEAFVILRAPPPPLEQAAA